MNLDSQIDYLKADMQRKKTALPKMVAEGKLSALKAEHTLLMLQQCICTLTQLRGITGSAARNICKPEEI